MTRSQRLSHQNMTVSCIKNTTQIQAWWRVSCHIAVRWPNFIIETQRISQLKRWSHHLKQTGQNWLNFCSILAFSCWKGQHGVGPHRMAFQTVTGFKTSQERMSWSVPCNRVLGDNHGKKCCGISKRSFIPSPQSASWDSNGPIEPRWTLWSRSQCSPSLWF